MDANKILHRVNLRGLVKCKECNHFNGIRANSCKNKSCKLSRIEVKRKPKPKINAVQLITKDDCKLYSVQTRERDNENRDFVSITDKIISSDANGSIISRNAICYADTCKYDSNDVNISCKHVKSSLEFCSLKAKIQKINYDMLNAFQMDDEEKQRLWNLYKLSESTIPMVQRINQTTFVVRCDVSVNFPAGLLHVNVFNEHLNSGRFSCACKKIKILMSSNQVILEKDICEHLILVFVAIMSDSFLKQEFKTLIWEMQSFFSNNVVLLEGQINASIVNDTEAPCDDLPAATIATIEHLNNIELIQIPNVLKTKSNVEINIETENDENLQSIEDIPIVNSYRMANSCGTDEMDGIELIKILNQFEVEDQIEFRDVNNDQYFHLNDMSDMAWSNDSNEFTNLCHNDTLIDNNIMHPTFNTTKSLKSTGLTTSNSNADNGCDNNDEYNELCQHLGTVQLEIYLNWLNSVIERLNITMDYNDSGYPDPIIFSIPQTHFDILRTKFSAGTKKKRLPNHTSIIEDGKYKGLTMFTWIFSNLKLVKHIFSTKTMQLETVKSFTKTQMNTYKQSDALENDLNIDPSYPSAFGNQLRKIRPTIYRTFLKVKNSEHFYKGKTSKQGLFAIEWIPDALPKSQYGELRIKLRFGHMKNNEIINE